MVADVSGHVEDLTMLEAMLNWAHETSKAEGSEFRLVLVTEGDLQLEARDVVAYGPGWVALAATDSDRRIYYSEAHIASAWIQWMAS
jgi:hypothetical protein